jgi:preprotein translocase subunit Sec61beta
MVKLSRKTTSGPSSAIGIMRFFDADTPGPKLSPQFVVVVAFIIAVIMIILNALS